MFKSLLSSHRRSYLDLQKDIANLKTVLGDTTHDLKARIGDIVVQSLNDVKQKSNDTKEAVEDYVSKRPFKSLGIAVVIGVLIGYLSRK